MKKVLILAYDYTAPQIDNRLMHAQAAPESVHVSCMESLLNFVSIIKKVKVQGDDDLRSFWLSVPRGSVDDFGIYEDFFESGEVGNQEEFNELYQYYYPDKEKWYQLGFASFQNTIYLYVDKKLTFQINPNHVYSENAHDLHELVNFLATGIDAVVNQLFTDAHAYHTFLENELPFNKRFGKIKRDDFWQLFPESKDTITANLSQSNLNELKEIVELSNNPDSKALMETITAADFFKYCSLGYNSIIDLHQKIKNLQPIEMYAQLADGRDCGFKKIDPNNFEAFETWDIKESHCGGHPWEILRGGNSTHISLYVERIKGLGWRLSLAGDSWIRVNETAHIALALHKNHIPFVLQNASGIYSMVTGSDFIGIVPDLIFPRCCHSHFPKEDQINDFMNLSHEHIDTVIDAAIWFPLEMLELQ